MNSWPAHGHVIISMTGRRTILLVCWTAIAGFLLILPTISLATDDAAAETVDVRETATRSWSHAAVTPGDDRNGPLGNISDYRHTHPVSVEPGAGNPAFPGVQPLRLTCRSGAAPDAVPVDCTAIDGPADIAVYGAAGEIALPYEVERLPAPGHPGTVWVYGSWVRDGTVQAMLAYGDGPGDRQDIDAPWTATPTDPATVLHLAPPGRQQPWTHDPHSPVTPADHKDPAIYRENGTTYVYANNKKGITVSVIENSTVTARHLNILHDAPAPGHRVSDQDIVRAPPSATHRYWLFYQVNTAQIRVAKSDHPTTGWNDSGALLTATDLGVRSVIEPSVIHDPGSPDRPWKMIFIARREPFDRGEESLNLQVWYAHSRHGDTDWTVSADNPVLSSTVSGKVDDPDIVRVDGTYRVYVNAPPGPIHRYVGTTPTDLRKEPEPVLTEDPASTWDDAGVQAPDVHVLPDRSALMAYMGGTFLPDTVRPTREFAVGTARGTASPPAFPLDSAGAPHGTVSGTTAPVDGRFGAARRLARNSTITAHSTGMRTGDGFTVLTWVRVDASSGRIARLGDLRLDLAAGPSGPAPRLTAPGPDGDRTVLTGPHLEPGWHLIAVTTDGSTVSLVVDGRTAADRPVGSIHDPSIVVLGGESPVVIDEVRLYDGPLPSGRLRAADASILRPGTVSRPSGLLATVLDRVRHRIRIGAPR